MKKIFLTTLIFSVVSCSVPEVPIDSLVERNGIVYQVNSDKPYSGKAIEYYDNGQAEYVETFKKGRVVQTEFYSSNGALESKGFWKGDEKTGVEEYYENGQLAYKSTYKNGEVVHEEGYWENGQLQYKATYKNGNLIQEEEYYKNGEKIDESNY